MNPWTDLLFLTLLVVFVVDLSGFTDAWLGALSRWLGHTVTSFKPFTCSLCMTWWCGIIYLIVTGRFCLPLLAYVALMAFLSLPFSEVLIFIREKLLEWIRRIA
jgi:hypothetical protein